MVIKYALLTEKSIDLIEKENKLVFCVDKGATKKVIKDAVEELYNVKVSKVNTVRDMKGNKKAFVKLEGKGTAADLATKLNML